MLQLRHCVAQDLFAALAAIAALPNLRCLQLEGFIDQWSSSPFPNVQHPDKLTQLVITKGTGVSAVAVQLSTEAGVLRQMSAFVNLEILRLHDLPCSGLPGGFPPQLSKLTCLDVCYAESFTGNAPLDMAAQFQHLSSLTALQELAVQWRNPADFPTADAPNAFLLQVQQLSQLTRLQLPAWNLIEFSNTSTYKWASMTALQSLSLSHCVVEPDALAALTQLRALSLDAPKCTLGAETLRELLLAVSKMSLLTQLCWYSPQSSVDITYITALTASTNLCSLELRGCIAPEACVLFRHDTVYPKLRTVTLLGVFPEIATPVSQQQLQQLGSCCPAIDSLSVELWQYPAAADCQVLLQLPALTKLEVQTPEFPAAVLDAVVQLTGLKQLKMDGPESAPLTLLPLTTLTALEHLSVGDPYFVEWKNKARRGEPPDVWVQLQRLLLADAACQNAQYAAAAAAAAASVAAMDLYDQHQG